MKKEIVLITILIIAFVFLSPLIVSFGLRELPITNQKPFGDHRKVYGEIVYNTNIIGEEANLLAVGLSFRNYNLLNKKDITMILYNDGIEVRKASVNGGSITDGGLIKFRFAPLVDSKDKSYSVEISSKDSNDEDSLQVYFDSTGSDLNYQLFYKPNYLSTVTSVYNNWLAKLLSDKLFLGFYVLAIIVLGVIIIKQRH